MKEISLLFYNKYLVAALVIMQQLYNFKQKKIDASCDVLSLRILKIGNSTRGDGSSGVHRPYLNDLDTELNSLGNSLYLSGIIKYTLVLCQKDSKLFISVLEHRFILLSHLHLQIYYVFLIYVGLL